MMEIDLVYLWVDGSDPVWRAKKRSFLGEASVSEDDGGDCRFTDNDEIKFSLRSVERFAPWIRRIFIVTDGQCPSWLDTSNPRVQIVDHREIVPEKYLPVFNSCVLELYLAKIQGLSEHFLYANDDMLFGAAACPEFFFDQQGRPIARHKKQSLKRHQDRTYPYTICRMQQEILRRFGKHYMLAPHHNIDAYRKSDFEACCEEFREEVVRTSESRVRSRENLQRSVFLYYALARDRAVMREVTRFNQVRGPWSFAQAMLGMKCGSDSRCIAIHEPDLMGVMAKYRPVLFCMNDAEKATDEDRIRTRRFLEAMFPEKSQFER